MTRSSSDVREIKKDIPNESGPTALAHQDTALSKTEEKTGCFTQVLATSGAFLSILFLLNFTLGIFEIPDNLPIIGNLDEVAATTFLLTCLSYLGINIIPRKKK